MPPISRFLRNVAFALVLCPALTAIWCQTTATPQLRTVQSQAWAALVSAAQPTTVALDGTFTSTAGSLTQNGDAHLTVGSNGTFLINLSGNVSTTSESRTVSDGVPACTWTDSEGVVHNSTFLNCMPPAWFFPGLTLLPNSSDASNPAWSPSSYAVDSLGDHLQFQFVLPNLNGTPEDSQLLSPFDLVLDPNTHLPLYAKFTAHPDNPGIHADIPVQIAYSDYRNISGVMVPFHIQRYLNGSLVLDLTITSASVQ
jgi:hypothetical protein